MILPGLYALLIEIACSCAYYWLDNSKELCTNKVFPVSL